MICQFDDPPKRRVSDSWLSARDPLAAAALLKAYVDDVTHIYGVVRPRRVTSVELVGDAAGVHISWRLGEPVLAHPVHNFMYSVVVTGNRGSFVRTFSVRFVGTEDPEVVADVHELVLAARGPSRAGDVIVESDSVSIQFFEVGLGSESHDSAYADLWVNGVLVQERLSVSVLEG